MQRYVVFGFCFDVNSAFLLILLLSTYHAIANPLNGYYQITSLTVTKDGKPVRGSNNGGLYIHATDRTVKIAGAWRGFPLRKAMTVEKAVRDTLYLRDGANLMKFLVVPHAITGRQSLTYEDGTREIIETIARIRKMTPGEVDKVRDMIDF